MICVKPTYFPNNVFKKKKNLQRFAVGFKYER